MHDSKYGNNRIFYESKRLHFDFDLLLIEISLSLYIDLDPQEQVLMDRGYRIDAIVGINRKITGVKVDGPYHFIGRSKSPLAGTILRRKQVPSIDCIELVSVGMDKLGKTQTEQQEYLRKRLDLK